MQRTIKWLLIIGALIVWGLTDFVSTLATCQHEQQEKAQQSPEKSCGFADSLTAAAIKDTAEWIDTRHDFVTATATIVVAFFTFTLWRATNRLWDAGERQLRYLSETAERQLRAYVFVVQIKVTDPDSQHPQAEIVIRNTGHTPAHDTIVSSAANVYNFPPPTTVFDPTPVGPDSSRFVFGPDGFGHKHIPLKTLLNEVVMRGMRDGNALIRSGTRIERPTPGTGEASPDLTDWQQKIALLVNRLTHDVPVDVAGRSGEQHARWLLAYVLDWHRREEKAVWWEYFRLYKRGYSRRLDGRTQRAIGPCVH